ncbi:MAG TPA: hypothetical protein VFR87_09300 [Nocardioidaceae bacterium]|nr:hypothetical protein [Nocardioidaceae bacterium]
MAFWRRGQAEKPRSQPDPTFDFLTVEQAARLRELARVAFAEAGVETVPHAQHLEAVDGRQFGLWNLAAGCAQAPGGEPEWPLVVREHVATTLHGLDGPDIGQMPAEDVLALAHLRLVDAASMPPALRGSLSYARDLPGGLLEVVAVDLPDTVSMLTDEDVARVGEAEVREAGLRNLVDVPVESYEVVGEPGAGALHVVEGSSFFTASKLLAFESVLGQTWGSQELPYGAVVAVPTRHMLVFHPVEAIDVLGAVQQLTGLAASFFDEHPGGVSPFVYWWHQGELTQLSAFDEEGSLRIEVGDGFTEVLNELAARG